MNEKKSVLASCPVCKNTIIFDVEKDLILNSHKYPIPFVIEHCDRTLITYVDAQFNCRGIESVYNIIDKKKLEVVHDHIKAEPINSEFIDKMSSDEKIILICDSGYDLLSKEEIPNVLDKQILMTIAKHGEISLAILIKNLSNLEKALNRKIDRETILGIIERYIKKKVIKKQFLKFHEGISTFSQSKIFQSEKL
ncbi:MAG: hypothetical protein ACFE9T_03010 [Promethearchaeota archaeon]